MSETTTLFGPSETRSARPVRQASRGAQAIAFFSHRAPVDAAVNVMCAVGAAVLMRSTVPHAWLLVWLGVVGASVAGRFLCHVAQRRCAEGSRNESLWSISFLICTAVNGAAWGVLSGSAFEVATASHLTGVLVLVAFALASAVHALAPFNAAFPLYYAGAVLPWAARAALANNPTGFPDRVQNWLGLVFGQPTDPALLSMFFGFGLVLGMVYLSTRRNAITLLRLQQQSIALMQARDSEAQRRTKIEVDLKDAEADLQDVDAELKEVDLALNQERAEHAKLRSEFGQRVEEELASHRTVLEEVSAALNKEREQHRQTREALLVAQEHGMLPDAEEIRTAPPTAPVAPLESEPVAVATGDAEHLLGRIDTLLDFARLGPGELPLESGGFSVRETVDTCCAPLVAYARDKNLELIVAVADDVKDRVAGDGVRVRRILSELLGAAIDYTARGEVYLQVTMDPATSSTHVLRFSIQSRNATVSQPDIDRLLSSSYDGDDTGSGESDVRTLGLTLAAGLCRALGGRLWSESSPGEGVTFRLALPFSDAPPVATVRELRPAPSAEARAEESFAENRFEIPPRILIANDDPTDQALIRDLLNAEGYETDIVSDGATAVESAASEMYDLLILDWQLPIMDGLEAATLIRENESPRGRHTPIVALGAHDSEVDRRLCRSAGMDDFVTKPIVREELSAAVARQLQAAREMRADAQRLGNS